MFGWFCKHSNTEDSGDQAFESASACAAFFAALLLLIDTVIAVSIFVSGDVARLLGGILACVWVSVLLLRVLISSPAMRRSKPLAVSI